MAAKVPLCSIFKRGKNVKRRQNGCGCEVGWGMGANRHCLDVGDVDFRISHMLGEQGAARSGWLPNNPCMRFGPREQHMGDISQPSESHANTRTTHMRCLHTQVIRLRMSWGWSTRGATIWKVFFPMYTVYVCLLGVANKCHHIPVIQRHLEGYYIRQKTNPPIALLPAHRSLEWRFEIIKNI